MLQKANQNLPINDVGIHRTQMQKEIILQKLKERGCRITRQRKMLLDVILNEDCSSCKEIYYKASMKDSGIGTATVYRYINHSRYIRNWYSSSICTYHRIYLPSVQTL